MKRFADIIKEYGDFAAFGGVSDKQIKAVEQELGLNFSKEYKEFLKEYGAACANGHEFLGICDSKRLNIVEGTVKARKKNGNIPENLYLIEDIGIDRILIWQNATGKMYQTIGKGEPTELDVILQEYVEG